MKEVTRYITTDGKEFDSRAAAQDQENKIMNEYNISKNKFREKIFATDQDYTIHRRPSVGTIWHVCGEDPNCDFGGSHHTPTLGYFVGTFEEAIDWAVRQSGWNVWGEGGSIKPIKLVTPR